MIACVTFETTKVTDPVDYYEINKIHIIHYVNPSAQSSKIYNSFYERVKEIISENSPRPVEVVEWNEHVSDFSAMLKTVLSIIQEEKKGPEECEIYVNISSGTSEYAAASAIASMMVPGTIPFSVGTREYTVDLDRIEATYFLDGKPVGLTKTTYGPRTLPSYSIHIPEEHLVRGLRILGERNKKKQQVTSGKMIAALKDAGLWYRNTDTDDPGRKSTQRQTEAVYYQRDFIGKWVKNNWVVKDELTGKYVLTPEGQNIVDTFYTG